MAKITRINPDGISKPFSNYSHVVTAEGAQKLCSLAAVLSRNGQYHLVNVSEQKHRHASPVVPARFVPYQAIG
jgi:hypothetical protein